MTQSETPPARRQPRTTLGEIYRRLVRIHYPLAESPTVDADLHRYTLDRLNELLSFVEEAEAREHAGASTSSQRTDG